MCTATGHVHVTQGSLHISGDTIKVFFTTSQEPQHKEKTPPPKGTLNHLKISHMEIIGHAHIRTEKSEIWGGHALWNAQKRSLDISQNPRLQTSHGLFLCAETMHYDGKLKQGTALGAVSMSQKDRSITCELMLFSFETMTPLTIHTVNAKENVLWKEKNTTLSCKEATYIKSTENIMAHGDVKISQGEKFVVGEEAIFHIPTQKISVFSHSHFPVRAMWKADKKRDQKILPAQKEATS